MKLGYAGYRRAFPTSLVRFESGPSLLPAEFTSTAVKGRLFRDLASVLDNPDNLTSIQAQVGPLPIGRGGQSVDGVDRCGSS